MGNSANLDVNSLHNNQNNQKVNKSPDALHKLLGDTFLTNDGSGDKNFAKGIAPNQVVGLYFSAHWCPPCRQFTPYLKKLYEGWKKDNHSIEIVFVSGDRDADSFKSYFNNDHANYLALPYGAQQIQSLNQHFQVRGIPSLIFLDGFGNVIEMNGRDLVQQKGANAINELLEKASNNLKPKAFEGTAHSLKKEQSANSVSMYDYIEAKEAKLKDESDECGTMQIVLCDGSKKTLKMNLNKQNVGDLFAHIKWLNNPGPFQLLAGFPPKVLKDETQTIKDAQLKANRTNKSKKIIA